MQWSPPCEPISPAATTVMYHHSSTPTPFVVPRRPPAPAQGFHLPHSSIRTVVIGRHSERVLLQAAAPAFYLEARSAPRPHS